MHPEAYSDGFARLCAGAGVPKARLHDARHSVNSLPADAGVPDHVRAKWCGHTVAVNVRTYSHASAAGLAQAGAALEAILTGTRPYYVTDPAPRALCGADIKLQIEP
jgi:integrase